MVREQGASSVPFHQENEEEVFFLKIKYNLKKKKREKRRKKREKGARVQALTRRDFIRDIS